MRAVLAIIGTPRLPSSMMKLYDRAGDNPKLRFSPFCWRTKMALLHKGLAFETIPWRFTEKDVISRTGQGRVPVLVDGDEWIHDSWQIAVYLDRRYPDRPALMATEAEHAAAFFVNSWCDLTLHPTLRPLIFLDVFNAAAERDRGYFRASREKVVGQSLEKFCADPVAAQAALVQSLAPIELTLRSMRIWAAQWRTIRIMRCLVHYNGLDASAGLHFCRATRPQTDGLNECSTCTTHMPATRQPFAISLRPEFTPLAGQGCCVLLWDLRHGDHIGRTSYVIAPLTRHYFSRGGRGRI